MKKRLKKKEMFDSKRIYRIIKRYFSELYFDEEHNIKPLDKTYNQRKKAIYKLKNKAKNRKIKKIRKIDELIKELEECC